MLLSLEVPTACPYYFQQHDPVDQVTEFAKGYEDYLQCPLQVRGVRMGPLQVSGVRMGPLQVRGLGWVHYR